MDFTSYAQEASNLVNAHFDTETSLRTHLQARPWLAENVRGGDIAPLLRLQHDLSGLVDASADGDGAEMVRRLNELLGAHPIRPRVSGHDESTWHLHVHDQSASVAEYLSSEALLGLAILVTELGATRLGRCAASKCSDAFVDTSANRSRRFCSTRCATRTNVAALRRRRQAATAG
ncbi:MAG: CGNR zinc finger domain-containing protein [Geodermatophilaceae bacterium]|nr:CGNR zinc finger domain-containing protein [Geodermatophilaceae bacterium]